MTSVLAVDGEKFTTIDYCEIIHTEGAEVLARYDSEFYKGTPAATVNQYGNGKAYYIAFRDKGDYTDRVVESILKEKGISSAFDGALPFGVTAPSREDDKTLFVFLENFTNSKKTVSTTSTWKDAESGEEISGEIYLCPLQTKILKKDK